MTQTAILFDTGFITRTPGALAALIEARVSESRLIERHQSGDFGELSEADKESNRQAIEGGGRVFSAYQINTQRRVWVITEADRSVTTLLLPSEY